MLEISFRSDARICGTLFMDRNHVERLTNLVPSEISLTQWSQPGRERVEQFIENIYAQGYGSKITQHYPTLVNVRDQQGNVIAAVGLRMAAEEPLFLERYLDAPIEKIVGKATGAATARDEIVEIGNLASAGKGASVFLFVTLAAYLRQRNLSYAVVTATKALRRSFALFGIEFAELAPAKAAALPDNGVAWGSYYTRDPRVLVGAIQPAFSKLEPFLPLSSNDDLQRLFARLCPPAEGVLQ